MRLLLLTARPELDTNRRLEAAAHALGVVPITVDASRVVSVPGPPPALWNDGENLLADPPEGVLARVGNWRPETVLAALEVAVAAGCTTSNPPSSIRIARDHWRTVQALSLAGLPVPATVAGADPERLAAAAASHLGFPVVVKQRRSRMGVGVVRCASRDHLESVLDSLWRLGDEVIVQRYVPTDGQSLRLLVVGGEVVAAARLHAAADDWRSNAARGGSVQQIEAAAPERQLATSAARVIGLEVCGVDLLPGDSSTIVEVNPTPGFLHLEAATGADVAGAIVLHLVRASS